MKNALPIPAGPPYDGPRSDPELIREGLLGMAEYGQVRVIAGRASPVIDFSPDLRDHRRRLWSFYGRAFRDVDEAERVRKQICRLATELGSLPDAIDRFRGRRSQRATVWAVCQQFLAEAPRLGSNRTGQPYAARTLAHYSAVLKRARPQLERLTMGEFFREKQLMHFRAWFTAPAPEGRGLASENEAANCLAALRAVVRHYQLERPEFEVKWPAVPTKRTMAKRARKQRLRDNPRGRLKLTLPEVVRAIEVIPEPRRPLFWCWFFTQARKCEIKAVLAVDYDAGRLLIGRSAESKRADAEIRPWTKTDHDGAYQLPAFVVELIDRHCTHARFDPALPLFLNQDPRAGGPLYSDDAIDDTWRRAVEACGLPWVPPYQAMKHTPVSALRDADVSIEDVLAQTRLTNAATLESHYDEAQSARRDAVVVKLAELAGKG